MSTPVSIQERLQMKRVPFDNWSVREQLCLASAVLCSGDQNWMSVSRSLKFLCDSKRPADWFSQKSCAAQYGKLLESVETPKRKKRTASERDSSTPVETPNESIVRKLTQERITEMKKVMMEEQQQFQKLKDEILLVQNGQASEAQLREMWAAIEDEKRQNEVEKTNHDEWLKRREQRKLEVERAWRPGFAAYKAQQAQKAVTVTIVPPKKEEESDETQAASQRSSSGQSPLLTSLLKSPSSTSASAIPTTPATPTTSRSTGAAQINLTATFEAAHNYQSPISVSQSAPTLSMLLDKDSSQKTPIKPDTLDDSTIDITADIFTDQIPSIESGDGVDAKDEEQLMEVFKGLIPDNIDDLADILTDNNAIIPEILGEGEEILEKVDALIEEEEARAEEVIEVAKMDTFDQLKNESIIEERKKREAAAAKAEEEAKAIVSTSDDSRSVNVSPEDSNQEDDIPLRTIQKDMEAIKAKEDEKLDEAEDRETPVSEETFQDKPEVITDETSSTDPSGPVEIKQELEDPDIEFENKPMPKQIKEEIRKSSDDEEIFEDAKEQLDPVQIPTDTDDDSKLDDRSRSSMKRPRKTEESLLRSEDSDSRSSLATRTRSKDHERSESPDDDSDNTPRRARRFSSSTPVLDSVPNSPVPEDKEQKAWRKLILVAHGRISSHKNAQIFSYLNKEDQERRVKAAIVRPMDMSTIKKNIENGSIRSTSEFQRDIMLMCTNIMMTVPAKSSIYLQAREMMHESIAIIKMTMDGSKQDKESSKESASIKVEKETPTTATTQGTKQRGSRKSQRVP